MTAHIKYCSRITIDPDAVLILPGELGALLRPDGAMAIIVRDHKPDHPRDKQQYLIHISDRQIMVELYEAIGDILRLSQETGH
jgi:hypothetical protein